MKQNVTQSSAYKKSISLLKNAGIRIRSEDTMRPWGGFLVIDPTQTDIFIAHFFAGTAYEGKKASTSSLQPKILIVAPHKRLSWQYHFRRSEIWRVVEGPVAIMVSDTDEQTKPHIYQKGDVMSLKQGERHRLIGLDTYGIVAEIWEHTDKNNPSDEDDIVRVQDDGGR